MAIEGKAMRRVRRSANAVKHGPELLGVMTSPKMRTKIVAAAKSGAVAVTAVSAEVLRIAGKEDAKLLPIRQFVGSCLRAVLDEEGYEVAEKGVRISHDPVFRTGAVYRPKAKPAESARADLLARVLDGLTKEEAARAVRLLQRRLSE